MNNDENKWNFVFILIVFYALFSHIYFISRFNGRWIEWDTGAWTKYIQVVYNQNTIFPTKLAYTNGYGYQLVSTFLLNFTNASVQFLQILIYPVIGVSSVFVVYLLFLEFTGDRKIALLSTFLLFISPDFLFRTVRGSHEKFTFFFIMFTLFVLTKSFTLDRSEKTYPKKFGIYVLLFYAGIISLVSFNMFFAFSYILAITFAFILGYLISNHLPIYANFKRLMYTAAASIALVFSNMFYLYPPAMTLIYYANTVWERMRLVAFSLGNKPLLQHAQYSYIVYTWPSFRMYLFLTLFNWVIAPLSLIAWIKFTYDLVVGKKKLSQSLILLLIFYAIFSAQLLIFIYTDRFGPFTHLELRIFPILMFFAVPLAAIQMFKILNASIFKNYRHIVMGLFVILLVVLTVNSLLKATMEPTITNEWMFYTNHEKVGLNWSENHLSEYSLWAGLDNRLISTFDLTSELESFKVLNFVGPSTAKFYFLSSTIEDRLSQMKNSPPFVGNFSQIYDNGDVRIYDVKKA